MIADNKADNLSNALKAVMTMPGASEKKNDFRQLLEQLDKIRQTPVKVLVCGEFKRGKSSFVNALLGNSVCAVDQDICTAVVSIIRYGEKPRVVRYHGDADQLQHEEIAMEDLSRYTTGKTGEVKTTFCVEIELPLTPLKNGLVVIDTPGVGGLEPRHAFVTNYYLPQADIVLFMTDANEPLTVTELDFYKNRVLKYAKHGFIVLNKTDLRTTEQTAELEADIKTKVGKHCGRKPEEVNVLPVSSKIMQMFNKTKVQSLYAKSGFPAVYAELSRIAKGMSDSALKVVADNASDLLASLISSLRIEMSQIETPDPGKVKALQQRQVEIQQLMKDLNDPASDFRMRVQKSITEERERVISALNEQSILFSSGKLSELMHNEQALAPGGAQWVCRQLNQGIQDMGADIVVELREAFQRIAAMDEFKGMLHYTVKDFDFEVKAVATTPQEIPMHKQVMSLMPGMGAGFATNFLVGGLLGLVGVSAAVVAPVLGVAVGLGIAAKSHSDTVKSSEMSQIQNEYQPQITVAMQKLRTFVETRFSEFQQEWISVIAHRVKDSQQDMEKLLANLNEIAKNQKLAISRRLEIERLLKPLEAQQKMIQMLFSNPLADGASKSADNVKSGKA